MRSWKAREANGSQLNLPGPLLEIVNYQKSNMAPWKMVVLY